MKIKFVVIPGKALRYALAKVALREARRNRDAVLYLGEDSLVSTAQAVQQYVKAVYGFTSQQRSEVIRISFTKPKVR